MLWATCTVALELVACATPGTLPTLDVNIGTSEPSTTTIPHDPSVPATEEPARPVLKLPPTYSDAQTTTHPAVLALLSEATRQENGGDLEVAAAKLERALRIEPRNAVLWHHLATVRLRQGQAQLAVSLAQKSNSFAAHDSELVERNQRIIEQARGRN
ncbi:MAG: tetratricopeptide repeat protein [Gammaproteobacteria bacterium]|nr:tetratricopeptide repeat protein [Gammaproteobacteria bacterium]